MAPSYVITPRTLRIDPVLVPANTDPYDLVDWRTTTAEIKDPQGRSIYRQENVEFPARFSPLAVNVTAQKYFYGPEAGGRAGLGPEAGGRESSYRQVVARIADTIAAWGEADGYFDAENAKRFRDELVAIHVLQLGAFNSPVWFNVGIHQKYGIVGPRNNWRWCNETQDAVPCEDALKYPQIAACFIGHIEDTMESIMANAAAEAMLFKWGSGIGASLSALRSGREFLAGGGRPSGPLSFFKIFDSVAGVVKSGGRSRRAARLNCLHVSHPDIHEFLTCKAAEERKAQALIRAGYDPNFNGDAYGSVAYQNTNISFRATDTFMRAAEYGEEWQTHAVTTGTAWNQGQEHMPRYKADWLLLEAARAAWECGDPGIQFEDTIQRWHTVPNHGPITASNPCGEYVHVDESACNLASVNWLAFRTDEGFDLERFRHVVQVLLIAQEILVDRASYPTAAIARNSHRLRPLGQGPANVGALLMAYGLPYDSDAGRDLAGAVMAFQHVVCCEQSQQLASLKGPFAEYEANADAVRAVLRKHYDGAYAGQAHAATRRQGTAGSPARWIWDKVLHGWKTWDLATGSAQNGRSKRNGATFAGLRNSQLTLSMPTGTIAFVMDCVTTGPEPALALVQYKQLAGGGLLKITNPLVPTALHNLGYTAAEVERIGAFLNEHDTIEDVQDAEGRVQASGLKPEHLPIFDCAFPPPAGVERRSIAWPGHIRMLAALQPHLSGAISKTVNMPRDATPEDIRDAYLMAWRLGVKCLAVYRDNSKESQPVSTTLAQAESRTAPPAPEPEHADLLRVEPRPADSRGRDGTPHPQPEQLPLHAPTADPAVPGPRRTKLPRTRQAITHHFEVAGHGGYLTVGLYPDGTPGELFITMAKEGSTIAGLMDTIGVLTSYLLQYGVPLGPLVKKLAYTRFEPAGFTSDPKLRQASSLIDYIFRWLDLTFEARLIGDAAPDIAMEAGASTDFDTQASAAPAAQGAVVVEAEARGAAVADALRRAVAENPLCENCGALTIRSGRCFQCHNCGTVIGTCGG